MKLNRILLIAITLLAALFTACDNDDDKNSRDTVLEAYGPSPALRGGTLTFIGRNLDNVTKVILPEDIVISDIEVLSRERIQITVPQDAAVGYVELETRNGKTMKSKTLLTYTEPIEITSISPLRVKAGNTITIEGDYLNLIQRVVFADDVIVDAGEFLTHERAKIIVKVPVEAKSGNIVLADTAAIPLELKSKEALDIVLPSVAAVAKAENKKPGETFVVEGADFDLVKAVVLEDKDTLDFVRIDNSLSINIPKNAKDGIISAVAYSNVAIPVATLSMAVPEQVTVTPASGIQSGDVLVIKGVNMELVTSIGFPNLLESVMPVSQSSTEITTIMPDMGASGDLILNTASGKQVSVVISTLKPIIEGYEPATVAAGNQVTIKGENMNLVTAVTFGGDQTVEVIPTSGTELTVTVPVDAETGNVILTMKNGEQVTAPSLTIEKPECCYIPVLPGEGIVAGSVLAVEIKNGSKLTGVQLNNKDVQYILLGEQLYVSIASDLDGKCMLRLISSNGEISYTIDVAGSNFIETIVFEGLHNLGNWNSNFTLDASVFASAKTGATLKITYVTNDTAEPWWQMALKYMADGWPTLDGCPSVAEVAQGSTEWSVTLSADAVNQLKAYGFAIGGHEVTISKVALVVERSKEIVVFEGPQDVGNWSGYAQIDASKFANATVGGIVTVIVSDVQSDAQGSLKTPNGWGEIAPGTEYFEISGDYQLNITEDILIQLKEYGLIVGGKNYIIQSVTLK